MDKSDVYELTKEVFPPLLREIPDAPKTLYARGPLPDSNIYKYVTVVGSRKYSSYGKDVTEKLIEGLAGHPVVIVSGLALGIDAIAHEAALRTGLLTIGVPGSGLDWNMIYPRTNLSLARKILEKGGALLSEYPPETKAALYTFPRRNRIMAGMSHATLLIEAGEKSGTLITARLVGDYNRDLLVVPGSIFSPTSVGVHQFLRLGATPVTSSNDILEALNLETRFPSASLRVPNNLSEGEQKIFEILTVGEISRDELTELLELPAHETSALLSMLELKGVIKEELGTIRLI